MSCQFAMKIPCRIKNTQTGSSQDRCKLPFTILAMRINHRSKCFSQEEGFVRKIGILAGGKSEVELSALESIRP